MTYASIEEEYRKVLALKEDISALLRFKKLLESDRSPGMTEYHYELLRDRENLKLYLYLRTAFKERPDAEKVLLEKEKIEQDPYMRVDILQLLGHLRSVRVVPMARKAIQDPQERMRNVAIIVLGWTGEEADIPILTEAMLRETSHELRINAASAHYQMAIRYPSLKESLIKSLKQGFEQEQSDEVLPWIILSIGWITENRLGLRVARDDPSAFRGDLCKAKELTGKFLKKISLSSRDNDGN